MVDISTFVRMSVSLWKMSMRTSLRTSQRTSACFEYGIALLLDTHLEYYDSNQCAYLILTTSEGSTRTRRHALREESMREHFENFVWDERQPRKSSRCAGLEHTWGDMVAAPATPRRRVPHATTPVHTQARGEAGVCADSFQHPHTHKLRGSNSQAPTGRKTAIHEDTWLSCPHAAGNF